MAPVYYRLDGPDDAVEENLEDLSEEQEQLRQVHLAFQQALINAVEEAAAEAAEVDAEDVMMIPDMDMMSWSNSSSDTSEETVQFLPLNEPEAALIQQEQRSRCSSSSSNEETVQFLTLIEEPDAALIQQRSRQQLDELRAEQALLWRQEQALAVPPKAPPPLSQQQEAAAAAAIAKAMAACAADQLMPGDAALMPGDPALMPVIQQLPQLPPQVLGQQAPPKPKPPALGQQAPPKPPPLVRGQQAPPKPRPPVLGQQALVKGPPPVALPQPPPQPQPQPQPPPESGADLMPAHLRQVGEWKTRWCQQWWRTHTCRWGDQCGYAHNAAEYAGTRSDLWYQWSRPICDGKADERLRQRIMDVHIADEQFMLLADQTRLIRHVATQTPVVCFKDQATQIPCDAFDP